MDPVIHNNEDNECKITIINNDCLAHIFSFLSIKEMIKIERVCKWWQFVSLESWSTIKKVEAAELLRWNSVRSDKPLKCILKRCGPYVKYLTVDLYHSDLKVISEYCTDLQSLEIINFHLHKKIRDSSAFRHIEELKIFGGLVTDKRVEHLFELCPSVKSITFSEVKDSFGLPVIPRLQSLEKLEIINCRRFWMKNAIDNFESMKNLKSLSIATSDGQVHKKEFIRSIESLPNLEHLRVSGCRSMYASPPRHLPAVISKLLISLNVHDNSYITDDLLKKCLLTVSIWSILIYQDTLTGVKNWQGCNLVTEVGVRELAKLPNLKYLTLSFKKWVSDTDIVADYELEQFALRGKLEKLKIRQNKKITDRGCSKILSLCVGLVHFDISGCSLITDATMVAAETAIQYRENDKKLKLLVGGTSVSNIEKWKNLTPLLVVHDKYSERLKTDFELNMDNNPCRGGRRVERMRYGPPPDILESDSDENTNSVSSSRRRCPLPVRRHSLSDDSDY